MYSFEVINYIFELAPCNVSFIGNRVRGDDTKTNANYNKTICQHRGNFDGHLGEAEVNITFEGYLVIMILTEKYHYDFYF